MKLRRLVRHMDGFLAKKWLFIISGLVVLGSIGFWWYRGYLAGKTVSIDLKKVAPIARFSPLPSSTLIDPQQKIATVGKETLYGADYNYQLENYFRNETGQGNKSDDLKKAVLDKLASESALLQYGLANKMIPPSIVGANYWNSPEKDQLLRQSKLRDVKQAIESLESIVNGEMISVWWHNGATPKMGIEAAEAAAKRWISQLRSDIVAKKLTFEQAAEQIRNNQDWASVDPLYKINAYQRFAIHPGQPVFVYPALDQALSGLKANQVSEIIRVPGEKTPLGSVREEFYALVGVNSIEPGTSGTSQKLANYQKSLGVKYFLP